MHATLTESPPPAVMSLAALTDWLRQAQAPMLRERFLARLAIAALQAQPAAMVSLALSEQWHRYFTKEHAIPFDAETLHTALSQVIGLGIGLERLTEVLPALADTPAADLPEALIAALQPETMALHMHPRTLRATDEAQTAQLYAAFAQVRETLRTERGIITPELRLEPDLIQQERGFAFRVNDTLDVPFVGLARGTCFADIAPDDLKAHRIDAAPILNPATGTPASRIDADDQERVVALGVAVWDQLGYVMACATATLYTHAPALISSRSTQAQLDELRATDAAAAAWARETLTVPRLTGALRELARAGVSVRPLGAILQHMRALPAPDDMTGLRRQMAEAIIAPHRTEGGLPVYALSQELEALIAVNRAHSEAAEDRILAAVGDGAPPTSVIVSSERTLPALTALLRPVYPHLTVMSREEIPPGTPLLWTSAPPGEPQA